jgi:heme-degrading monooxygenase HmoA
MTENHPSYIYIWEFIVNADSQALFEKEYGFHGSWVRLFRKGEGYLNTELYHDRDDPTRYLTVDHWISKEAYETFRNLYAKEFEDLDHECSSFTSQETFLGSFLTL